MTDPSAARDFTATSLWVPETQAMPVATASDLGVLALSLVRHLLEPIKAKALREPEAAKDELTVLFAALPVPDARDLTQTVKDLKNLTPGFRQMLQTKSGRKAMKLNAHYFGASVTAFQSGYDGHWITREAALRLRLGSLLRKNERRICVERTPRHGHVVAQRHGLCGLERWLARLCL